MYRPFSTVTCVERGPASPLILVRLLLVLAEYKLGFAADVSARRNVDGLHKKLANLTARCAAAGWAAVDDHVEITLVKPVSVVLVVAHRLEVD